MKRPHLKLGPISHHKHKGPFHVSFVQPCDRSKHCHNYMWIVTEGGMSCTAFSHNRGLAHWIRTRRLKLTIDPDELNHHTTAMETQIIQRKLAYPPRKAHLKALGRFYQCLTLDKPYFDSLDAEVVPVLQNGEYTAGKLCQLFGSRAILVCNPNVRDRKVFDYHETRERIG